jgi:hypothetical protein
MQSINKHIIMMQRLFREKKLNMLHKNILDLQLINKFIDHDNNEYKIFIHTNLVHDKFKLFIETFELYLQKKIILPEHFGYSYLIFGYGNNVINNDDIIKSAKNIVLYFENINTFNEITCNKLCNLFDEYRSQLILYSMGKHVTLIDTYDHSKICTMDNIIHDFYDSVRANMEIHDKEIKKQINDIQLQHINTIYKLCGNDGIKYMRSKLNSDVIDNLNDDIVDKLKEI